MASALNSNIVSYDVGEIPVKGAVTVRIDLAAAIPAQTLIDAQYLDSQIMDKRPGMYLKYFPYGYDQLTGKILTGGYYLFDKWEDAKGYARWTTEEFKVGEPKVPFWERPLFDSTARHVWKVVGAHNFAPMVEHAVIHVQLWTYQDENGADMEAVLRDGYPALRSVAESQGRASLWVLHDPEQKRIGLQVAYKKVKGSQVDEASVRKLIEEGEAKQPSLDHLLPKGKTGLKLDFDRVSPILVLWLPKSRAAGGNELAIPLHPFVPDITHPHK